MKIERNQILSLYMKIMKKFYKYLIGTASEEIDTIRLRLKEVSIQSPVMLFDSFVVNLFS